MWGRIDKIHIVLFMFAQHPNCLGIRIVIEYMVNCCAVIIIHLTRHTKMAAPEGVLLLLLKRIHCVCLCDRHQELSKGWSRYKKSWSVRGKMQRVVDCNTNSAQRTWKNNIRGWDRDGWNIERNKRRHLFQIKLREARDCFLLPNEESFVCCFKDLTELQKERQCLEKQHQQEVNKLNQELQQARTLHNALQAQTDKVNAQAHKI